MELLFNRLPGDMRDQLIRRIAKFALGNTLPSVAGETGVLLSIPGNAAPEQARQHILEPLLASLESELPSLMAKAKAAEGLSISKVSPMSQARRENNFNIWQYHTSLELGTAIFQIAFPAR